MKDQVEKDRVARLILSLGADAIPALEEFLRRGQNFARAMELYRELAGTDAAKRMTLELLAVEGAKSGLKPTKKHDLLVMLSNFKGIEVTESAVPYLEDFDEGCRFAAVEVLIAQEDTPALRDALLARLGPQEESGRVRHRVADIAVQRRWPVGEGEVPEGFRVQGGLLVQD